MNENFWHDKNVLITGGRGFLGSWIIKQLLEFNTNIHILVKQDQKASKNPLDLIAKDTSKIKVFKDDITNINSMNNLFNNSEIEYCFHLAAQPITGLANMSPTPTFQTNIVGTWNILEAARLCESFKGLVVASSYQAYGEHDKLPYTEDFPLNALYPYEASKVCTDVISRTYFKTYELPVAVTRCSNIYGGGDLNFSRIVPDTFKSLCNDTSPQIRSDGNSIRDYIYITDAVNAYITLMENLSNKTVQGEAFNFGTGRPMRVIDLVKLAIEICGKNNLTPIILGKSSPKAEIRAQYLSSEKAKRVLGWQHKISLEEGLKTTYQWYKNYFSQNKNQTN